MCKDLPLRKKDRGPLSWYFVVTLLVIIAYGLVVYGLQFLMRGRLAVFSYIHHIILPEMVYTVLITVIFYRILFRLNRKLTESEWEGPRLP